MLTVQQIADGGIGIYPFMNEGTRYTLLTAIWRIGMTQEMTVITYSMRIYQEKEKSI